jgi:hypothetical protein
VRQVNFQTRTVRLDAGTTKNDEGREVAMTAKVAELLRQAILDKGPEEHVVTRTDKKGGYQPATSAKRGRRCASPPGWEDTCARREASRGRLAGAVASESIAA